MAEQTIINITRARKSRAEELIRREDSIGDVRSNGPSTQSSASNGMHANGIEHKDSKTENSLALEVAQIKVALQTMHHEMQEKHAKCCEQTSKLTQEVADLKQQQQEFLAARGQAQAPVYEQEQIAAHAEKISALARDVEEIGRKEKEAEEGKSLQEYKEPGHTDLDHHLHGQAYVQKEEAGSRILDTVLTWDSLFSHARGYALEESIWDSSVFLGFPCTGPFTSVVIFIGVLLTIAIEGSFIMVVFVNYRNHELSDDLLDGLLHWRAVVAHDIANYDPASQTSLASRVCMEEMSTDRSALQLQLNQDFYSFRNSPLEGLQFLNGEYLCNLALLLWFFAIVHEMIVIVRFSCSVLAHTKNGSLIVEKGPDFEIISFSHLQVWFIMNFVTLPRMLIAVFLGYAGLYFLAHTSKLGELLLNAVAMVFVLDIDEMLFYALLPQRVKHLTWNLCPLDDNTPAGTPTIVLKNVRRFAESLGVRIIAVGALMVWCNLAVLHPFTERLDLALHYMCDGNLNFLYTTNKVNQLVFYAEAPTFEFKKAHKMTYQKRAVLEIIGMDHSLFDSKVGDLPDAFNYQSSAVKAEVSALKRLSLGSRLYISSTAMCIDHTDKDFLDRFLPGRKAREFQQSTQLLIRDKNNPDFESCSEIDFESNCLSGQSSFSRGLCARTCGCDNPWSGQFFAVAAAGCAVNCGARWQLNLFYETPVHIAKYTDVCEDVPVAVLNEDISWKRYTLGLKNYLLRFEPSDLVDAIHAVLLSRGCNFLLELRTSFDFCSAKGDFFRSARYYCPASCMCAVSDMQECPNSCRYNLPHQIMAAGLECPMGLGILSKVECESAASEVLRVFSQASDSPRTVPSGCYAHKRELFFTVGSPTSVYGSGNISVPHDYLALCRSAQPFFPNSVSKGSYDLGKHCAECIIHEEPCAQECYSERLLTPDE